MLAGLRKDKGRHREVRKRQSREEPHQVHRRSSKLLPAACRFAWEALSTADASIRSVLSLSSFARGTPLEWYSTDNLEETCEAQKTPRALGFLRSHTLQESQPEQPQPSKARIMRHQKSHDPGRAATSAGSRSQPPRGTRPCSERCFWCFRRICPLVGLDGREVGV